MTRGLTRSKREILVTSLHCHAGGSFFAPLGRIHSVEFQKGVALGRSAMCDAEFPCRLKPNEVKLGADALPIPMEAQSRRMVKLFAFKLAIFQIASRVFLK